MNLIIVESPTKARTLSKFLGKDYEVEATVGHIKDLPKSKLSVDVDNDFEPDYQLVDNKKKYIKKIKKHAKKADFVYLATDPDREGEAISAHVAEILQSTNYKLPSTNIKRIVFHEITKDAVEHAISVPSELNVNLVNAQIARRVLDRLVGYKLSPLLWKKVRVGLSAGRVQTVVVRLIVEREREIDAFNPVEYWEIQSGVRCQGSDVGKNQFQVKLAKVNDKKAEIGNEKQAKEIVNDLENSKYKVLDVISKEVKKNPYPPFTTSTLTQSAANLFGWSSKRTMMNAQKLYENGLITYHRTDSMNIAKSALSMVRKYIGKEFGKNYLPDDPRFYKTKSKSAQEAHEAIRPTSLKSKVKVQKSKYSGDIEKLYELISKRFVASQMSSSVYDLTRIEVTAEPTIDNRPPTTDHYLLKVSGQVMKFDGWKSVYGGSTNLQLSNNKQENQELPDVKKDEVLDLIKVLSEQKFTQPPARFNEASLIKTLEALGIGRPSTYAPTISTIQNRNYVEKDERVFKPTNVGIAVNDFMVGNFETLFDYAFTAGMEEDLDKVAKGKVEWHAMMKKFYKPFGKKVKDVEKNSERVKIKVEKIGKKCPTCKKEKRTGKKQGELVVRTGRFGKFISCSLFPECKHTEKYLEKIGMKCPTCIEEGLPANRQGDVIVKKTRKGRRFYGCSRYPKCKYASWKKPDLTGADLSKKQSGKEKLNED